MFVHHEYMNKSQEFSRGLEKPKADIYTYIYKNRDRNCIKKHERQILKTIKSNVSYAATHNLLHTQKKIQALPKLELQEF